MSVVAFDEIVVPKRTGFPAQSAPGISSVVIDGHHPEWDDFVRMQGGDIVQTTSWAMSKRALGQKVILTQARGSDGNIVGGALLVVRRVKPGLRLGYVARGPVVDPSREDIVTGMMQALHDTYQSYRLSGLMVQPMFDSTASDLFFRDHRFFSSPIALGPEATIALDLSQSEEELMAAMRPSRRRNIRKSQKEGIDVSESDDVALFHHLHVASTERQGYPSIPLAYLQAQWDALAPHGLVTILVARLSGKPVAALWLTEFAGTTVYRLPGWDSASSKSAHVNEALHWTAITRAKAHGAKLYDFGGFDPLVAELILAGKELPDGFDQTPGHFKLCFNPTPTAAPRTKMVLRSRVLNVAARGLAPAFRERALLKAVARKLRVA